MNEILHKGAVPCSWRKTLLPKSHRARVPADFRPIANLRLLYKVFAYLVLGRIEATLEQHQPEEQHGFRSGRRIEEHLLTANMVIDKTLLANVPLWIVSLDLSKAFDRVSWDSLWEGLLRHGVSQHLVWALRLVYWEQKGQIITKQHLKHWQSTPFSSTSKGSIHVATQPVPFAECQVSPLITVAWVGLQMKMGGKALSQECRSHSML